MTRLSVVTSVRVTKNGENVKGKRSCIFVVLCINVFKDNKVVGLCTLSKFYNFSLMNRAFK